MTAPGKLDAVRSKRRMPGLRGGAEQAVDSDMAWAAMDALAFVNTHQG